MPDKRAEWGLYYYYHTMAKCLDTLGFDYVVDAKGKKHDWRKDITNALAKRQRPYQRVPVVNSIDTVRWQACC